MPTAKLFPRRHRLLLIILAISCPALLIFWPRLQPANTRAIYTSSDVVAAPPPSLTGSSHFNDARGSYERRCFGAGASECVNVLFTRKGFRRSGDLHQDRQVNHIITGAVMLTQRIGGMDLTTEHRSLETIVLPAHTPHLYYFLEDTLMTEYWVDEQGNLAEFKAWLYTPYRDLITSKPLDQHNRSRLFF
jgi:hypothetical protein